MWGGQFAKKYADVMTADSALPAILERTVQSLIHKDALRNKILECMNFKKNVEYEIVECKVLAAAFVSARARMLASAKAAKEAMMRRLPRRQPRQP